jgi:hypothetical protein
MARATYRIETRAWADDTRLSDIECKFACKACGRRGADVRPKLSQARMGER